LHVDAVMKGTVLLSGDRVRINARLIDASTDSDVWAQSYEGDVHDTLKLQSEIAGEIVEQFRIILNRQERAPLNNSMANNPDANGRGGGGSNKPVGHVGHAIAPEPDSANSYSGLAEAFASSGHR
jgi:hypothetical protein